MGMFEELDELADRAATGSEEQVRLLCLQVAVKSFDSSPATDVLIERATAFWRFIKATTPIPTGRDASHGHQIPMPSEPHD